MADGHKAQLRLCHERIAGRVGDKIVPRVRYCDLRAHAWCYDCDYFVCDIHQVSRHLSHRTRVE